MNKMLLLLYFLSSVYFAGFMGRVLSLIVLVGSLLSLSG